MNTKKRNAVAAAVAAVLAAQIPAAFSAEGDEGLFTLGQVDVTGERSDDSTSDDRVSAEEVWKFNANTLTDAVKLVPGVTSTFIGNGRRNEGDISVRGFDRWRVPLSIDGIRVYLPADNRIDFNRFLTPDLGAVQVKKGRVSMLDGPGAMGGAINLVTRKPVKEFEAEFQAGSSFDRSADADAWFGTMLLGTKQDLYYLQGSATINDRDSWTLSKDFEPVGPAEDGGERISSFSKDWRVNVKAGFTPNETDEYSLSFTRQNGEKGAPLAVDFLQPGGAVTPGYQGNNYWTWPYWDVQSVYWLSHTQLAGSTYLKTRLSYSEFDNALFAWDDINYESQNSNGRFRSYYGDTSLGGSVELGTSLLADSTTRAALHFRRDRHSEYNHNRPTNPSAENSELKQRNEERTWLLAVEHAWAATDAVDLTAGLSYDKNSVKRAEEWWNGDTLNNGSANDRDKDNNGVWDVLEYAVGQACQDGTTAAACLYDYPIGGSDSWNGQLAAQWHYASNAEFGASVSSRTRFANNFERYSTRFGFARPNPDLASERATHFELSWKGALTEAVQLQASVFYTDVKDMILTVVAEAGGGPDGTDLTQAQNVGDGHRYGVELAGDFRLAPQLRAGANYSYLHHEIDDPLQPALRNTGVPKHLGFAYLAWQPLASLTLQPSVELAGNRWGLRNGSGGAYESLGKYTLANLQVSWKPLANLEAVVGVRNLLDQDFELTPELPEPGRSFFTKLRYVF